MDLSNKEKILKKGQKTAKIATIATVFLALVKGIVGVLSGSILLIADAIHSAVDVVAIFSSWFGLKISQKKYNEKFPYGYYKAENFATLVVSFFIFFAAYEIFIESYKKLFVSEQLVLPVAALIVPLFSALLSYFIAVYEDRVGKEINSQSLIANAQESKIDVISSLVIFGGILLAYFNINYIESVIGAVLALMIIKIGFQNAKTAVYSLMDASLDLELEKSVKQAILKIENVKEVSSLKLRQSGLFVFGEASVRLQESMNIKRAHEIVGSIEKKIRDEFAKIEVLTVRVKPYRSDIFKILVPITDNRGLDSKIIDHFGRARNFLFATVKNKKITSFYVRENFYINQDIRAGLLTANKMLKENISVVLVKKIGEISFHTLRDNLIDIYLAKNDMARQVIIDFINKKLNKLSEPTHSSDK
ncbi:MAG: cation diffusion facilitator family transporter [Patescibacteria group bacterium]|nr:cation diffusion facilitator family transporter [Patescibacteria group bacterium]